jgi:hypothetical protein
VGTGFDRLAKRQQAVLGIEVLKAAVGDLPVLEHQGIL